MKIGRSLDYVLISIITAATRQYLHPSADASNAVDHNALTWIAVAFLSTVIDLAARFFHTNRHPGSLVRCPDWWCSSHLGWMALACWSHAGTVFSSSWKLSLRLAVCLVNVLKQCLDSSLMGLFYWMDITFRKTDMSCNGLSLTSKRVTGLLDVSSESNIVRSHGIDKWSCFTHLRFHTMFEVCGRLWILRCFFPQLPIEYCLGSGLLGQPIRPCATLRISFDSHMPCCCESRTWSLCAIFLCLDIASLLHHSPRQTWCQVDLLDGLKVIEDVLCFLHRLHYASIVLSLCQLQDWQWLRRIEFLLEACVLEGEHE